MGTTVTTHLSLIKPDADESIQANLPTFDGWAVQQAANMDTIDALFRKNVASFTPTWSASPTPPTLGTGGFVDGKYVRITPRIVCAYYRIFTGTAGFLRGSGSYSLTLPVAVDPTFTGWSDNIPFGRMIYMNNAAVANSSVFSVHYSPSLTALFARIEVGGSWSESSPVLNNNNDRYSAYVIYPTAVA